MSLEKILSRAPLPNVGASIQEKSKPTARPPPPAIMAEDFPGLGPASGGLDLLEKTSSNSKKNKKKQQQQNNGGNSNRGPTTSKQPAEPASLSSIADFLGQFL